MDQNRGIDAKPRRTMYALQCARGFAAILVVYYHASAIAVPSLSTAWIMETFSERFATATQHLPVFGACGVDLFFVLSGYIIWTSTKPAVSTLFFYRRRIARIVPLYWVVTLVTAAALLLAPSLFKTLRFSLPHLASSLAFVPWRNPAFSETAPGALTPLVVAGWTLNFEMMFYVLFGFVCFRREHRVRATIVVFFSFAAAVLILRHWIPLLRFYDPLLITEFLLGCFVAAALEEGRLVSPGWALAMLLIMVPALVIADYISPPVSRLFTLGLPAAAILYALTSLELQGRWPRLNLLEKVGDASYSIYLVHFLALGTMRLVWHPVSQHLTTVWVQALFALSIIVSATMLGLMSFRYLERPLVKWAEALLAFKKRRPAGSFHEEPTGSTTLALKSS